jgi:hypothetical protein
MTPAWVTPVVVLGIYGFSAVVFLGLPSVWSRVRR